MLRIQAFLSCVACLFLTSGCIVYSRGLNSVDIHDVDFSRVALFETGRACSWQLFGGLIPPFVAFPGIRVAGDQSLRAAIEDAGITNVYIIDREFNWYVLVSEECTIVHGE